MPVSRSGKSLQGEHLKEYPKNPALRKSIDDPQLPIQYSQLGISIFLD
jgi:hypothetical protein